MDNQGPAGEEPPQFGIGKFLFSVILALILLLLIQTMVHHRFFRGGTVKRYEQPVGAAVIPVPLCRDRRIESQLVALHEAESK
jgi:hypothetical protein